MKEVAFSLMFLLLFRESHFVMFSGLLVFFFFFFCEAVILYNLFCSKTAPIFFCFA